MAFASLPPKAACRSTSVVITAGGSLASCEGVITSQDVRWSIDWMIGSHPGASEASNGDDAPWPRLPPAGDSTGVAACSRRRFPGVFMATSYHTPPTKLEELCNAALCAT